MSNGYKDLAEVCEIFSKYADFKYPTYCQRGLLIFVEVDPEDVSDCDIRRLGELGVEIEDNDGDSYFCSSRFGG